MSIRKQRVTSITQYLDLKMLNCTGDINPWQIRWRILILPAG